MQTKANAGSIFLSDPTTANDTLYLTLEANLLELMIPLGYLKPFVQCPYQTCQFISSRLWAITITAHTFWGWWKPLLQTVFHTLGNPRLDYPTPPWQLWFSNTNITSLDRPRNQSLLLITGQLVSAPLKISKPTYQVSKP